VTVHPNIIPFLKLYPLPNSGLVGNGDTGNFATSLSQRFNEDFFTTRIDHRISSQDSLFGTYMFDTGSLSIPDALNNVVFPNRTRRQMIAIEETHTFNQNFINSFRLGYNRTKGAVNVAGPALNPSAADLALGSAPGRAAAIITVTGLNADAVGVGGNSFFRHVQNSYQIYDDAFLTRGNHSLRFGAAFEKIDAEGSPINYVTFRKGTFIPQGQSAAGASGHRNTWRIAHTIAPIREWVFRQHR